MSSSPSNQCISGCRDSLWDLSHAPVSMKVSRLALMQYEDTSGSPMDRPNTESGRQRRDSSPAQLAFSHQLPVSTQVRQAPVLTLTVTKHCEECLRSVSWETGPCVKLLQSVWQARTQPAIVELTCCTLRLTLRASQAHPPAKSC